MQYEVRWSAIRPGGRIVICRLCGPRRRRRYLRNECPQSHSGRTVVAYIDIQHRASLGIISTAIIEEGEGELELRQIRNSLGIPSLGSGTGGIDEKDAGEHCDYSDSDHELYQAESADFEVFCFQIFHWHNAVLGEAIEA